MKLKTYQSWTMAEALAFVKSDLGSDAVILHTRTFERGGFFGIGRRSVVEITAARAQDLPRVETRGPQRDTSRAGAAAARPLSAPSATEALRGSAAARAYGAQSRSADSTVASQAGTRGATEHDAASMELDREKTRRLAQAMTIALEKQAAARQNASRNEDAVREVASWMAPRAPQPIRPESAPMDGPAQRFVLTPDSSNRGGAARLMTAMVREESIAQEQMDAAAAIPTAIPAAITASISPTHSSVDPAATMVESKAAASEGELDAIADFVGRVLKRSPNEPVLEDSRTLPREQIHASSPRRAALPHAVESARVRLIDQELDETLVDRVIAEVLPHLTASAVEPTDAEVRRLLEESLVKLLPVDDESDDPFEMPAGRHGARRIAFVGPTGVGKTTTLAKIAAQLKLKHGLRVGIVAADTYRIAAVDQLRTYAEILDLPVEIASSPKDAARACASLCDVDVILIDTAGRSQNDHMKISELRAFLGSAQPDETHLVLSATASLRALTRAAETFGAAGVDRILLTKLDEAASFGALVSLVSGLGKRVSFFTQGQEVPDHIEIARSRRLAGLVLGSFVR